VNELLHRSDRDRWSQPVTDWNIRRWKRYGHDRVYAETPGGTTLGYLDLKTNRLHADDVSNLPILQAAIAEHLATTAAPEMNAEHRPEETGMREATGFAQALPSPPAVPPSQWVDLSQTRAGAAAREQANAAREAAPFRTALARLLGVKTEERAWRIGADGEQAVAAQLAKLGPGWHVLHAVRVGENGSDIDLIVIGLGGVFTVNAKHHPNGNIWVAGETFMVNGQRTQYIRNSRHEAKRAGRLLSEHVGYPVSATGIIAVMGAQRGFTIKEQPADRSVVVLKRKKISHFLAEEPIRLTPEQVNALFDIARRSTTWTPKQG
jgi:hypothetical protein